MKFTRNELIELREKALKTSEVTHLSEQWKRAFEKLADSADYIDAMIARTEEKIEQ